MEGVAGALAGLEDKLLLGRFAEAADAAAELVRQCGATAGGDLAANPVLQRGLVVALQGHFYCGRCAEGPQPQPLRKRTPLCVAGACCWRMYMYMSVFVHLPVTATPLPRMCPQAS
jgi:hypothetical protein